MSVTLTMALEGVWKRRWLGSNCRVSDSVDVDWAVRMCMSHKFLGDPGHRTQMTADTEKVWEESVLLLFLLTYVHFESAGVSLYCHRFVLILFARRKST